MYIDILKAITQKGPLQLNHIENQTNVNSNVLKGNLDFLIKQGLIRENALGESIVVYSATNRGNAIIKFFGGTDETLSLKEEGKFLPVPY